MSESFEGFLKKKSLSVGDSWINVPYDDIGDEADEQVVFLKDLGEWAWAKILTLNKEDFRKGAFDKFYSGRYLDFYLIHKEIAVACLGKKEVEKRLKQAGRDE